MEELKRQNLGAVHTHTHTHTHTSIFIQRVFLQWKKQRCITNKLNEIMERSYISERYNRHY